MAVTAESVVVELLARTDDFERKMGRAANDFDGNVRRMETSQARLANAQRNLGFQFQDFTTQVASGGSVFTAFAQQAGQASGALADLGGTAGKVGAFLSGPYGSIIIAATAILGNLALAHIGGEAGAKKQEKAEKALADALTALDQAAGVANVSQREKIRLSGLAAEKALKEADAVLAKAEAELKAREILARGTANAAQIDVGATSLINQSAAARDALKEVQKAASVVIQARARIREAQTFGAADLAARAAVDPLERIRQQTAEKVDAVKALKLSEAETTQRLTALYKEEAAAIGQIADAARKARGSTAEARRDAKKALDDRISVIQGIGLSSGTEANLIRLEKDRAAGKSASFLTQARRGDFDAPIGPAKASELIGSLNASLPKVVLDFKELEGVVDDIRATPLIDPDILAAGQNFAQGLSRDLANAVIFSGNIGDALVNSFKRAAAEFVASKLFDIFGSLIGAGIGGLFGGSGGLSLIGRASGGPVSAGQVVRINETGQELFRPSVPGRIVPAGESAMMRGSAGAGIVQNISINFAGNAATREEAAEFARIAYEQSIKAMQQSRFTGIAPQ